MMMGDFEKVENEMKLGMQLLKGFEKKKR